MAFENKTPKVIRDQIIANTGTNVSTAEGTFVADMAAAVALEMSKNYGQLDRLLQIIFVNTEEYEYLDARAGDFGVYRKPGEKATGMIMVTGTVGAILPKGTIAQTADGLRFVTDAELVLESESGTVAVTAVEVGDKYNVDAGGVDRLQNAQIGITAVTNAEAMAGGVNVETDEALRARLLERVRTAPTSGNVYHYRMWALETPGVGGAKVIPLAYGPGTVEVLIVDDEKQPPEASVVDECAAHIEEVRPIGAVVTVTGALGTVINVSATVTLDGTTAQEKVQADFAAAVDAYLKEISFDGYTVSPSKIGFLLMSVPGVADYTDLLLNGADAAVSIPSANVPVMGGVTIAFI